jgi:hypothetical protein
MKLALVVLSIATLLPATSFGVCIIDPPGTPHPEANAFLATVVGEEIVGGASSLRHGEYFRVRYTYAIREILRGAPRSDLALYSELMYSDPATNERIDVAEAFAYQPGTTLIVAFDNENEVQVALCAPSTEWRGTVESAKREWAK